MVQVDMLSRTALTRGIWFFALWFLLMPSTKAADLALGAITAACATYVSLRLLPPSLGRVRLGLLLLRVPRLLWQSLVAGVDIARRALDPRLPLDLGFVEYRADLPSGTARNGFTTITGLLPGTVPAGEDGGAIVYHCLDTMQPVVEQLAAEERRLTIVFGSGQGHG